MRLVAHPRLTNVSKSTGQSHAINLNDADTLQRHLEMRFAQLNIATELELWQEAFGSIEDINTLFGMSKKAPKQSIMANYFEKLSKIFLVSNNLLFHSAALSRYYSLLRALSKAMDEEESRKIATNVVLAVLASPIVAEQQKGFIEIDGGKNKANRLSALLGMPRAPTRTSLLNDLLSKGIVVKADPIMKDLYHALEVDFHPLTVKCKLEPIFAKLAAKPELEVYMKPLYEVLLSRLLQQLSQVYSSVSLDTIVALSSYPSISSFDRYTIEKYIMNASKSGELNIKVDHATKCLRFETAIFEPKTYLAEGPFLQSSVAEQLQAKLTVFAQSLNAVMEVIDPSVREQRLSAKSQAMKRAIMNEQQEHQATLARKAIIERKKELIETLAARKEKAEALQKAMRAQREAEAQPDFAKPRKPRSARLSVSAWSTRPFSAKKPRNWPSHFVPRAA